MESRFSEASAATWRVASAPMIFARTEAQFSRSARDYIYLGPVEVNRRGVRDYYLWVGIGSTLDREFLNTEMDLPTELTAFVDAEPFELTLDHWNVLVPSLATEVPYDSKVRIRWHLAARVTLDQLELLTDNNVAQLVITTAAEREIQYRMWTAWSGWPQFVANSR